MKMKNKEVVALWNTLYEFTDRPGTKFAYALLRTKQKLHPHVVKLQMLQMPSKEFIEFDSKRVSICSKFADRDEKGNPVQKDGNFVVTEKVDEFKEAYSALSEEYKAAQEEMDAKVAQYNVVLDEEIDVDVYRVSLENCPQNFTAAEIESIMVLISDTDPTVNTIH